MIWMRIPNFSRYEISDKGDVRRAECVGNWMPGPCSVWIAMNGYAMTDLTSDQGVYTSISVHRLLLSAFIRPPRAGEHVRHMDGCKTNNTFANLRYGSASENAWDKLRHGTHRQGELIHTATLTVERVLGVVADLDAGGTYAEIAQRHGTSKSAVGSIARGLTWKHVTGGIDRRNGSKFAHRGGLAAKEKRQAARELEVL